MEEEEEICRVCRSEATTEQPLFHPCKCSGSIRYVHQDCLIEWLSHSRKKYCELCEHPFTFTPVYRQDMPEVLPAKLFFVQIKKRLSAAILITLRAILVSCIWLIVLPYFTIWIWRFYFFLGSNISRGFSKLQDMKHQLELSKNMTTIFNMTAFFSHNNSKTPSSSNWFQDYKAQLTLHNFLADCFEGQIITCIVIVIFVAVFLLREWIVQNIPMDNPVEEDIQEEENQNFDNHASSSSEQTPPSPIAVNGQIWYDTDEPNPLNNHPMKSSITRSSSLPPTLSTSFQQDEDTLSTMTNDTSDLEYRRSSSMEPYRTPSNENSPNIPSTFDHHDEHRGYAPNAPRMRHAEAPAIPVIAEEEERPVGNPNNNNDDDDDDDDAEEFEGILEAIGMQGSLWSLAQNGALMALLITLSLGAAVWLPYLIGMLFIMTETFDLIRIPLKLARYMTDPLIDYMVLFYTDTIKVPFYPNTVSQWMNATEPYVVDAYRRYQSLAIGQTTMDRFACISVGYIIVTIVSCWYLTRSNNRGRTAVFGRTAQEALRHQGMILKVGMFITIELVLFPTVCGFLLDLTSLPLFETATFTSRGVYTEQHPVASLFLHWFLGTGFMFLFAVLVTVCREVVRPGVMWFIRDPNDPQFHPIREIVERAILFQFKKIGTSALIYITVIVVGVGGVVHVIDAFSTFILPLRWDLSHCLSTLPIDLIIVQTMLPAIVNHMKPKQKIKQLFVDWMRWTCRQFRLTSFMLGGRHPEEEGDIVYHSWRAWIQRVKPSRYPEEGTIDNVLGPEVSYIWHGQLLRVPRHDSVPIIEGRRMLVPLDNFMLEPLDAADRQLGHPAATAPGGYETNTVIVYSPPAFKQRVVIFVGLMWLSTILFICTLTTGPMLLGRWIFGNNTGLHDMYAFSAGWLLILVCNAFLSQVARFVQDVRRQSSDSGTSQVIWSHTKQWSLWILRWTFFTVSFVFIVPISLGLILQLYFVTPLLSLGEEAPSIAVLPMWAHGVGCMIIVHGFIQIIPNNSFRNAINDVFRNGIHEMKLELCIRKLMVPFVLVSLTAIFLPYLVAYIQMQILARNNRAFRIQILQTVYPMSFAGIATYFLGKLGSHFGKRLAQNIREDNYLVGRTLHNLE